MHHLIILIVNDVCFMYCAIPGSFAVENNSRLQAYMDMDLTGIFL